MSKRNEIIILERNRHKMPDPFFCRIPVVLLILSVLFATSTGCRMYSWRYVPEMEQHHLLTQGSDSLEVYVTDPANDAYWLVDIHQVGETELQGAVIGGPDVPLEFRGRKYPDPARRQVRLVMSTADLDRLLAKDHFMLPVADLVRIQEFKRDPGKAARFGVFVGLAAVPIVLIATRPDDFINIGFPGIGGF